MMEVTDVEMAEMTNIEMGDAAIDRNGTEVHGSKTAILKQQRKVHYNAVADQGVALQSIEVCKSLRQGKQFLPRQSTWQLINGEADQLPVAKLPLKHGERAVINWSLSDGCWMWTKRLLSIGNVLVILACFCFVAISCCLCLRR